MSVPRLLSLPTASTATSAAPAALTHVYVQKNGGVVLVPIDYTPPPLVFVQQPDGSLAPA